MADYRVTWHLTRGEPIVVDDVSTADLAAIRTQLSRRLNPNPPAADEPPAERVFQLGKADFGAYIPVGHIVRVSWEPMP